MRTAERPLAPPLCCYMYAGTVISDERRLQDTLHRYNRQFERSVVPGEAGLPRPRRADGRARAWARESMMVAASPFLCMMLSWGNLVVELALPLMVLLASTKARDEWRRRLTVDVFAASLVLFHLSILVLMGPNFLRMVPCWY